MTDNHVSEIAVLRARIEAECVALRNLTLFSSTASHAMITAKHASLDNERQELAKLVGESEALETVCVIYNKTVN